MDLFKTEKKKHWANRELKVYCHTIDIKLFSLTQANSHEENKDHVHCITDAEQDGIFSVFEIQRAFV